ncbi:MAG: hypothetical protein IIX13_08130 [Bacteroidales bacterium]|nr:hypothetical protein [Bacteroidales bacterium]
MERRQSVATQVQPIVERFHQYQNDFIVETSEHAAKRYLSTLAVLQLDAILTGAQTLAITRPKKENKNQQSFERMMIMTYPLPSIGIAKMTVGVRRLSKEKVQYCITAISGNDIKKAPHE